MINMVYTFFFICFSTQVTMHNFVILSLFLKYDIPYMKIYYIVVNTILEYKLAKIK